MPRARSIKRAAWVVIPIALVAGAASWRLAASGDRGSHAPAASDKNSAPGGTEADLRAANVLRARGANTVPQLIDAYRDWAADPNALVARKLILNKLFAEQNLPVKLSSVLSAVEADPTPPESDPLWDHLVESLANVWEGETLSSGLDLMFAESRPRAKRALVSSFALVATSERVQALTPLQHQTLVGYFIDMYAGLPPSQKPEVALAVRSTAGNDVADLLLGKGLDSDDELESHRAYKKALAEAPPPAPAADDPTP